MAYNIGDIVTLTEDAAENYDGQFNGATMRITSVAYNRDQHPGYDEGLGGQGLYDLVDTETGKDIPNSFYEYELEDA